jgi:hypothetical protein
MVTLQCFLTSEEIEENLNSLADKKSLSTCLYSKGEYILVRALELSNLNFNSSISKIFLLPKMQASSSDSLDKATIKPRDMGWLDVDPGKLFLNNNPPVLTLTTIQAENKKQVPFKPTSWLRLLEKNFSVSLKYGVWGINIKTGGSHFYNEIGYSSKALELYAKGVSWKQKVEYNVIFSP